MLEAKGICFEIEHEGEPLMLLNEVDFTVPRGHFMAIVGPSGCGKTTLLKTIAGINSETDGHFEWDGREITEDDDFDSDEIGYVPQFSIAYDELTVDESIESAAKLRVCLDDPEELDDLIDRVLEETGMTEIADRRVKILSGGQKRRLALAMELVSSPHLLLCDEVTSGLDPRSEKDIVQLLYNISRKQGRIVISVTHSIAQMELYDTIMVLHKGNIAFHGSPSALCHYFGVETFEEVYPKLQGREGDRWRQSWLKHRKAYYDRVNHERDDKVAKGILEIAPTKHASVKVAEKESEADGELIEDWAKEKKNQKAKDSKVKGSKEVLELDTEEEEYLDIPGPMSQFFTLFARRWTILFRNRTQLTLQIAMIILFPILVALFSSKGQEPLSKLSATQDTNLITELEQQTTVQQNHVKIGGAVSGIVMFEVILLGLMGSNNAAREIAGERQIMEKEKYGGLSVGAYVMSKLAFLGILVLVQSVWMYGFVQIFWPFRGDDMVHLSFLILANAAMTSVCLGISAMSRTADQASLLSIYLVGFQLPLSGAVLALPEQIEQFTKPLISAYWAWSGSLSGLNHDVYNAVKIVIDTTLSPANLCYTVLGLHILVGIVITVIGAKRPQWD